MIAELIFWLCAGVIAFTYAGYPLVLALLAALKPRPAPPEVTDWPAISVLIVAHDEEAGILDKVQNVLACDYPADRIEVIVCSDGSTDGTNGLVEACDDPRVHLAASPEQVGVNEAFALGAERAGGEVLLMTDAAGLFEPDAIRAAARHFADPKVGLVSGRISHEAPRRSGLGVGYRAYWLVEMGVKALESRLGLAAVVVGAFEMVRTSAYVPIPSLYSNDMGAPLYAHSLGCLCRCEPDAVLVGEPKSTLGQEFARRVRIVVRAWPSLFHMMRLVPPHRDLGSWLALLGHKYLRWLTWAFMLGALAANAFLLGRGLYRVLFYVQAGVYAAALVGWALAAASVRVKPFWIPFYFCLLQAAAMVGFFQALFGRRIRTWKPTD